MTEELFLLLLVSRHLAANLWLLGCTSSSHFSSTAGSAAFIARFFEEFPSTHVSLNSCVLYQLAKPFDRIVYIFVVTQTQLYHKRHSKFAKKEWADSGQQP